MPYLFKGLFLTISYLILMAGIADLKAFFVSILIFAGGILFDLYFAYKVSTTKGECFGISVARFLIYVVASISALCIAMAILGMANVVCVEQLEKGKYIILKSEEIRNNVPFLGKLKISFGWFLGFMILQVFSCGPDYLLNKMKQKDEQKRQRSVNYVESEC